LKQNISLFEENSWLFIRIIPDTHPFGACVKNRSIRFFDKNSGNFGQIQLFRSRLLLSRSGTNYDALLMGWDAQALQAGINFHGGNSTYCLGEAARTNMINNDGWMITDAGLDCAVVNVEVELSANSSDLEGSGGNLAVILVNGTITVASTATITDTATGTATSGSDYTDFGSPLVVNIPAGIYDGINPAVKYHSFRASRKSHITNSRPLKGGVACN